MYNPGPWHGFATLVETMTGSQRPLELRVVQASDCWDPRIHGSSDDVPERSVSCKLHGKHHCQFEITVPEEVLIVNRTSVFGNRNRCHPLEGACQVGSTFPDGAGTGATFRIDALWRYLNGWHPPCSRVVKSGTHAKHPPPLFVPLRRRPVAFEPGSHEGVGQWQEDPCGFRPRCWSSRHA